jgi:hypothetical protein
MSGQREELVMSTSSVTTTINYCGTEGLPPRLRFDLTDMKNSVGAPRDATEMTVFNARQASEQLGLDRTGFTLINAPTAVTDLNDAEQLRDVYYPEVEALLRDLLGAEEVFVFGHIYRTDDPDDARARLEADGPAVQERSGPAGGAHVDFDEDSIRTYVREFGGDRADELAAKRVVNINLWRGISKVERLPLALCDASTVELDQMVPVDMYHAVGPYSTTKVGLNVQHHPDHRWYYYPDMTPDEVLVFKTYDSEPSVARRTPHSAIVDPTSDPDAPPRHSLEIRALCFLPNQP